MASEEVFSVVELYPHQVKAVSDLSNGKILNGPVGSGKSRIAITYFVTRECGGGLVINGSGEPSKMSRPRDLFIITTARKRDTKDWEGECAPFALGGEDSYWGVSVHVDSWNNIKKYSDVEGAFFIFDEQRLVGSGVWVKAFLKIAKSNHWVLLSGTPGDTWMDYIPVFVANGLYKNRTAFKAEHCIFNGYTKYQKVERYIGLRKLNREREQILVDVEYVQPATRHEIFIEVEYDKPLFKDVMKSRWNIYEGAPCVNGGELCLVMRHVVNEDPSRGEALRLLLEKHSRLVVFYTFNYELDILRSLAESFACTFAEWNGHNHELVPEDGRWLYFVQYTAGAEGWNCISTDAMVFYSLSSSYRQTEQAKGRIDRLTTPYSDLYYYSLVSKAPIDVHIRRALANKKDFNWRDHVRF